jgi:hypothetical protein
MEITSVLDLGAGKNPQSEVRQRMGIRQLLLDLGYPDSDEDLIVRRQVDVTDFQAVKREIAKVQFNQGNSKLDAVVSIQNIEHLERQKGIRLLEEIEQLASKLVIIETPNGFVLQSGTSDNPYQEHLSGWNVEDFKSRGYKVYGTSGLKILKKKSDKGAYRVNLKGMRFLDVVLSRVLFAKHFPKLSFNLFAFKELNRKVPR